MTSAVYREDIDQILSRFGARARVVALWRRSDGQSNEWLYLGRLSPQECELELLHRRFGGGWYRAKIYGAWERVRRREEYLRQVSFGIAGPIGRETLEWMRAAELRRLERRQR